MLDSAARRASRRRQASRVGDAKPARPALRRGGKLFVARKDSPRRFLRDTGGFSRRPRLSAGCGGTSNPIPHDDLDDHRKAPPRSAHRHLRIVRGVTSSSAGQRSAGHTPAVLQQKQHLKEAGRTHGGPNDTRRHLCFAITLGQEERRDETLRSVARIAAPDRVLGDADQRRSTGAGWSGHHCRLDGIDRRRRSADGVVGGESWPRGLAVRVTEFLAAAANGVDRRTPFGLFTGVRQFSSHPGAHRPSSTCEEFSGGWRRSSDARFPDSAQCSERFASGLARLAEGQTR